MTGRLSNFLGDKNMANVQTQQRSRNPVGSPMHEEMQPTQDIVQYLREYAREKPEVAALWCFGIGFVLGWKLKPW
jgi:hypothetical protein